VVAAQVKIFFRALMMFRLLTVPRATRDVVETVFRIRDVLSLFVFVFVLIIYVFAGVGMDLFHEVLPPHFK